MKNLLLLIAALVMSACQEARVADPHSGLSRKLVGQWESIRMKITMHSYLNSDSTVVFEVDEKNWKEKMQIKPIRTFYLKDGSFYSLHTSLHDTLIFQPAGKWLISGDTLMMRDTFPERGPVFKYKLEIRNNMAQLWGKEDADNDGSRDDDYYAVQWRVFN